MRAAFLSCAFLVIFLVHLGESRVRVKRIVGGQAAAVPPEDDPVVYVYKEDHQARVLGIRERKGAFYTYQGIRYAHPPTGIYRFQRPRPMKMEGLINATRPPPPCPQPDPSKPGKIIGSEDCLFLNIYSAELPDGSNTGLPVLVWIHGGGYRRGSANQYGPGPLVKKKVVLVSIQYRLGSLGFLSAGAPQLSGNVGMFDMTAAVKWVQSYISFFGGDPKNIKTIGQGSGASSAVALGLSPVSNMKVQGVVAMSGSAVSPNAVDNKPKEAQSELADLVGCPSTPKLQLVRCLQQVKVEDLVEADSKLQAFRLAEQGTLGSLGGVTGPAPVVDGNSVAGARGLDDGDDDRFLPSFYPEPPIKMLNESEFPAIPLLTGVCKQETGRAVAGEVQAKLSLFKGQLDGISNYVNNIIGNQLSGFAAQALPIADGLAKLANPLTQNPLFGAASGVASKAAMSAQDAIQAATARVAEATTDVLFNLPAALTTSFWSQRAPAFLYSLEHPSKRAATLGQAFLAGLPVIESGRGVKEANQSVSHGDDLAFLFNARSLEGKNNDDELSLSDPMDLKLRDYFTSLVAEFARSGTPSVPGDKDKDKKKEKPSIWGSFSGGKDANYLVLDGAPRLGSDFRSCQLAAWTGLPGAGGGGDGKGGCNLLGGLGQAFGGVASAVGGVFGGGGGGGPLGLPLGGGGGGAPGGAPGGAAKPKNGTATAAPKKRRKVLREKPKTSSTPKPK